MPETIDNNDKGTAAPEAAIARWLLRKLRATLPTRPTLRLGRVKDQFGETIDWARVS